MGVGIDVAELEQRGFALIDRLVDDEVLRSLADAFARSMEAEDEQRRARHALRHVLDAVPEAVAVVRHEAVRRVVTSVLGRGAFAVRGIFFDKLPGANWKVPWHQDRTIAVAARAEVPGFGPWSIKAGVVHVEPPAELLERMITLRLHLDDVDVDNGPLRVLPESHRAGRRSPAQIAAWRAAGGEEVTCVLPRGGAMLMRPLLVHASSPAVRPRHRQVLHLEFATEPLPGGLRWHRCIHV